MQNENKNLGFIIKSSFDCASDIFYPFVKPRFSISISHETLGKNSDNKAVPIYTRVIVIML